MSNQKPQTINTLMAHMRNDNNIQIGGSLQKKKLRYMGYFHGYKGYRYYGKPSRRFNYTSFNELQAVYDFDMELKTLLYPKIMFLETALKNYVLEVVCSRARSSDFATIYSKLLIDYKSYPKDSKQYKTAINRRLGLRNKVYSSILNNYETRDVVKHYYDKNQPMPIWAIFEIISLGEFANFLKCLDLNTRKEISKQVGIGATADAEGELLSKMLFTLKDLRNAVAHNGAVFDTRFRTGKISKQIGNYINYETGIDNITFDSTVDYIILISFLMKLLKCPKTEIVSFIKGFESICENFRKVVTVSIYSQIIPTNSRAKILKLRKWISQ